MNRRRFFTVIMLILPFANVGWSDTSAPKLYAEYCSVCHGDKGDGRSRARGSMIPPPRDFTSPEATQELTRQRMIQAVTEGRPGTAMVGWKNQLNGDQIAAIVDYIRISMMLPTTSSSNAGRRLYAENCSVCHGDDGRGARWTLTNLKPPPRNFTLPGSAEKLSREYMSQVVNHGKADTAMPGFRSQLDAEEITAVVDYVRRAFMSTSASPSAMPANHTGPDMQAKLPGNLIGDISRGQAYYLQNCVACHGIEGDGRGPRAYFILPKPRNFQHPASAHGLNRPKLFTAISKGTLGSDMPAWEKVLSDQEIADIAEYVFQAFIKQRPEPKSNHSSDKG